MDYISLGSGIAMGIILGIGISFLLIKKALEKGNKALVEEAKAEGSVLKERKIIEAKEKFFQLKASDLYTSNPKVIEPSMMVSDAEKIMFDNKITSVIVAENNELQGILQLYQLKNN